MDDSEWLEKIGQKFRKMRIDKGFTSGESFSNEYGLSRKYYWKIETGQNMSILYFKKLCQIHATTIEEFLSDM